MPRLWRPHRPRRRPAAHSFAVAAARAGPLPTRRRRAAGSTRLACALRGRFFCFLVSRAGDMGVSRGRAPAVGFFTTTEDSQTAQGQQARERSLFLLLLPSADASGFARRGGWERPNRSSVLGWWRADPKSLLLAPARGPGPESQVRPILIFARHCLLPDVGHLVFAPAPSSRQSEPACAQRTADPATTGTLPRRIAA